jgi:hypothetical protein
MKRIVKLALVVIPALVLAATVGLTTMGCDDDTGSVAPVLDLSVTSHPDMTTKGG